MSRKTVHFPEEPYFGQTTYLVYSINHSFNLNLNSFIYLLKFFNAKQSQIDFENSSPAA